MERKNIPLQLVQQLRRKHELLEQYRYLSGLIEAEIASSVASACGVDLGKEHWNLDLENGVIERVAGRD
jgi:hypothetical protein